MDVGISGAEGYTPLGEQQVEHGQPIPHGLQEEQESSQDEEVPPGAPAAGARSILRARSSESGRSSAAAYVSRMPSEGTSLVTSSYAACAPAIGKR